MSGMPTTAYRQYRRPPVSRRWVRRIVLVAVALVLIGAAVAVAIVWHRLSAAPTPEERVAALEEVPVPPWIDEALLPLGNARDGRRLEDVQGIVIHYVGNPGTTAMNNRNYFAKPDTEVCSHFVVGLEGEIVQCVPLWERSAASNRRNRDTISVEICHPDESGRFTDATYAAAVRLTAWLCAQADLPTEAVIRHYDVTGKACPLYFVENPDAWARFLADVEAARQSL